MKKINVSPDAVTGTTTAKQNENARICEENGVKITNGQLIIIPGFPLVGKRFDINDKYTIYVQDIGEKQNYTLFEKGLKIIDSKVTPKRRSYLAKLFRAVLPKAGGDPYDIMKKSSKRNVCHIIALVCDIALHKNKKLAHPQAYHKDFNKYVENLFYHYFLDSCFEQYVQLGAGDLAPVPEFLVSPEKYNFVTKTA